jgi:hypothetical protein
MPKASRPITHGGTAGSEVDSASAATADSRAGTVLNDMRCSLSPRSAPTVADRPTGPATTTQCNAKSAPRNSRPKRIDRPTNTVGTNTHIGILSRPATSAITSSGGSPTEAATNMTAPA